MEWVKRHYQERLALIYNVEVVFRNGSLTKERVVIMKRPQ